MKKVFSICLFVLGFSFFQITIIMFVPCSTGFQSVIRDVNSVATPSWSPAPLVLSWSLSEEICLVLPEITIGSHMHWLGVCQFCLFHANDLMNEMPEIGFCRSSMNEHRQNASNNTAHRHGLANTTLRANSWPAPRTYSPIRTKSCWHLGAKLQEADPPVTNVRLPMAPKFYVSGT